MCPIYKMNIFWIWSVSVHEMTERVWQKSFFRTRKYTVKSFLFLYIISTHFCSRFTSILSFLIKKPKSFLIQTTKLRIISIPLTYKVYTCDQRILCYHSHPLNVQSKFICSRHAESFWICTYSDIRMYWRPIDKRIIVN